MEVNLPLVPRYNAIWACQTNPDPFDTSEPEEWTDYPMHISSEIERAFRHGLNSIFIETGYKIDLVHQLQVHNEDSNKQRPIRRQCQSNENSDISTTLNGNKAFKREDRLTSTLEADSIALDTHYQGSRCIMNWYLKTFSSASKVDFLSIYNLLIEGIKTEGQMHAEPNLICLTEKIENISKDKSIRSNSERMKKLREVCVFLYTEDSFLYYKTNEALRNDDAATMEHMGPFAFVLYDYIGRQSTNNISKISRLFQNFHMKKQDRIVVYRGDRVSKAKLDEYRRAVGNKKKCFKWLCFVSTSTVEEIAIEFSINILYEIDLGRYKSNDQFIDISENAAFDEKEILLRPGVRFCIDKIEYDSHIDLVRAFVHILPSYVSVI